MAELTAAQCEQIFLAALSAGDARGVESALTLLAVRDPHRAQELLDDARLTVRLAGELREAGNPDVATAIAEGNAAFRALVEAHRDAKAAAGVADATTGLLSTLINDTDPAVVVGICAAAVLRAATKAEESTR